MFKTLVEQERLQVRQLLHHLYFFASLYHAATIDGISRALGPKPFGGRITELLHILISYYPSERKRQPLKNNPSSSLS